MGNNQLSPDFAEARKRARNTAIVLGAAVVISLLFLMYAFVQKSEAERQRSLAEQQTKLATEYKKLVGDLDESQQAVITELRSQIDSLKKSCGDHGK